MPYERYDRDWRDEPRGSSDERRWRSGGRDRDERFGGERFRGEDRSSRDRGFFERAGDEIASWFGDEDRGRGRRGEPTRGGGSEQRDYYYRGDERQRGRDERPHRGHDRSYRPMGWTMSDEEYERGASRFDEGPRGYRPMAGDYGRSGEDRGRDFGRSSEWGRDPYRSTSFAGSSARSQHDDPHYEEWRRRQMDALDRDYEDYRRENAERFESDFGGWREKRESKRQMLGQVREHMDVVGKDGEHVGTVDRIAGDRIILTKSDPESGGVHHSLSCAMIDDIDGDKIKLDLDAEKARERWRDESRERALFEREDQGSAGPGALNRSFSGTYR